MNTITKEDIAERFRVYNEAYFEGKLPTPKFGTYISCKTFGLCSYNPHRRNGKISIARNVYWDEEGLKSVIVHEMIHLYLDRKYPEYCNGGIFRPRYRSHGELFKQEMRRFRKLGIKIMVSGSHCKIDYDPILPRRYKKTSLTMMERIGKW